MESMVTMKFLEEKYKGKKVFITGHTGFKGAWLTAILYACGAHVKGYALAPEYKDGLFDLICGKYNLNSVIADIRDKDRLSKELADFRPDYIFHLAAQPLVRLSYQKPAETFDVNVTGTANLLECATKLEGKCTILVITTDKVYENKENGTLYKEEDVLGGYDPYSASKACTELVVSSFRNSFFNPSVYESHQKALASARAGNVIGGGDWSIDRIVPDIVRALQVEQSIPVRNPQSVRPWQHVLEPLCGYLQLSALLHEQPVFFSQAYNFGPSPADHLTVAELVDIAIKVWGNGKWEDKSDKTQPHEAALLQLDISKAKNELHWQPRLSATEAIEWTIKWYSQPADKRLDYTIEQINKFLSL